MFTTTSTSQLKMSAVFWMQIVLTYGVKTHVISFYTTPNFSQKFCKKTESEFEAPNLSTFAGRNISYGSKKCSSLVNF